MYNFPVIRSVCHDPACNLALEEYLIEQKKPVLYLWQNEPSVVIGRNQNPYKECNIGLLRKDNVHLMRRRSGGGAVYHDMGNVNFTIISQKSTKCVENNFNLVKEVLSLFGISAGQSGRNDLETEGRKISGSAFYEDGNIYCHHGTMLVNEDLQKLGRYLTVSKLKLESKGIDSVRSRVMNLSEINSNISTDDICSAFCKVCGSTPEILDRGDIEQNPAIVPKIRKYNSWEWVFGDCMDYNVNFEKKFDWGIIEIRFFIKNGIIEQSSISTDSIVNDNFPELSSALRGIPFDRNQITATVGKVIDNKTIKSDIGKLFENM